MVSNAQTEYERSAARVKQVCQDLLPHHMVGSAVAYILYGSSPDKFLYNVVSNSFQGALASADFANRECIQQWGVWLSNMPVRSWGSTATVQQWMEGGGLYGRIGNG